MTGTFSRLLRLLEWSQPISFISPLPITECAKRLHESIGKPSGCMFTRIEGHVEKIDEDSYDFLLYQDDGRTRVSVSGRLQSQAEFSTLIDGLFIRKSRSLLFTTIMMVALAIATILSPPAHYAFPIIIIPNIILLVFWINRFRTMGQIKSQANSQLLWWFERTLKN